jgi:hypothetical protein
MSSWIPPKVDRAKLLAASPVRSRRSEKAKPAAMFAQSLVSSWQLLPANPLRQREWQNQFGLSCCRAREITNLVVM